jgi:hypothetical protein
MLTWKIGAEEDAVGSDKLIHSRECSFVRTQCSLVIKTPEVLQDFVVRQRASHVFGKDGDSWGEERGASAHVSKYNFHIWILAFLA